MNWGHKILILYSGFVIMTLVMVFMAYRHDVPLVSDDYYERELKYQDEIDMLTNAGELTSPIRVEYRAGSHLLVIHYPAENTGRITGKIEFMRPSDPKQDTRFQIEVNDQHTQEISTSSMVKGLWNLKVYWENAGTKYLEQQDLIL